MVVLEFSLFWDPKRLVAGYFKQVVVLYSSNCMDIFLHRPRVGCLK